MTRLEEWQFDMLKVVDSSLVHDLVNDFRRGVPQPKSILEETKAKAEPENKSGWVEARSLDRPRGLWLTEDEVKELKRKELEELEARLGRKGA
jgi:hypothetical protein